jgi:uridine phosphorylase
MSPIAETDLILNADGSVYHLNLLPEDIAQTIITVGDPDRVAEVSRHFDRIELRKGKREFVAHTGYIGQKRVSVVSTGIGTDNIDIVMNELDALVNIDLSNRIPKPNHTALDIIRIGTSGTIQPDIPINTILVSSYALGLDALMNYYMLEENEPEKALKLALESQIPELAELNPYFVSGAPALLQSIGHELEKGITVTAPGFYAPQGRNLRYQTKIDDLIGKLNSFTLLDTRITNLEMETAGIYALAKLLGHRALSVNAILASRVRLEFSKKPQRVVDQAIKLVLEKLTMSS